MTEQKKIFFYVVNYVNKPICFMFY